MSFSDASMPFGHRCCPNETCCVVPQQAGMLRADLQQFLNEAALLLLRREAVARAEPVENERSVDPTPQVT